MNLKIIFLILSINSYPYVLSSNSEAISFADKLFEDGDYKRAIIEYKRLNFFSPTKYFNYRIGLCYKKLNKLEEAVKIFEKLTDTGKIELIYTLIELKRYDLAKKYCEELKNKELLGYIYILEDKWDYAINLFDSLGLNELKIDAIYGKNLPYKKENNAILLSIILPGAGEIYSKKLFNGIHTFLLNAITLYFIFDFAKQHKLIEMSLVLSLWNRFYIGGLKNARVATVQYNKKIKSQYIKSLQKKYPQFQF